MIFKVGDCVFVTEKKKKDSLLLESFFEDMNYNNELKWLKQQKEGMYIVTKPPRLFGSYFQATSNGKKYTKLKVIHYQLATLEQKRRYDLKNVFTREK